MAEKPNVTGDAPIDIQRDEGGVLRIKAQGEPDMYRGLGFAHAWDRGVQVLLVRILGQGRASELLDGSDETLAIDRFFRRLGFAKALSAQVEALEPDHRALLEAYCDGINQALARRKPWELRLLGVKPEPWIPEDSILMSRIIGYISLAQSQGDMERVIREMIQGGVGLPYLEALFPGKLGGLDLDALKGASLGERIVPDAIRWQSGLPRVMASNNWVVAGSRSHSDKPILCNDPHLEINRLPSVWYEVIVEQGGRYGISATMPGLPGLLIARKRHLAWGATYAFMDAEDSWIEDCKEGNYKRIVDGEEVWEPFRVRREVIKRKKADPVEVVFYENDHGILSGDPNVAGLYTATRWAAADAGTASYAAIFEMWRAETVEQGMALMGQLEVAFNWLFADSKGHIGFQMSGRCPVRREGVSGLVPLPGWDPANDWKGFLTPEELPRDLNPECGYIATANDDLNHLGKATAITLDMGNYRAERIRKLLAMRDDHDLASMASIMMDLVSPQAEVFMEILRPLLPDTPQGKLLKDWDCRYDLDSKGATLFEAVYAAILEAVFGAAWGGQVHEHLASDTSVFVDFYSHFDRILLQETSIWYGDESRAAIFERAAAKALQIEPRAWGEDRGLVMSHILLGGKLPRFLGFDHGPIALPGGRATIHQGQIYSDGGRRTSFAPSYRLVTDFAEESAHTCLAGGPSDRRFSKWYTIDVGMWTRGEFKTLKG